jgi:nucleoside-diphosphate-sugar epimerase
MFKPKIFVAGHKGMVGSAIARLLKNQDVEIITKEVFKIFLNIKKLTKYI